MKPKKLFQKRAVSQGEAVEKLSKEIIAFAKSVYGLHLSATQPIEESQGKSFRRVADCYIRKMRVPKKDKERRRKIREAPTLESMVELIVSSG